MARTGRPRTGETPLHSVRVPKERWEAALQLAVAEGTTITAWINHDLQERIDAAKAERPTSDGRAPGAADGSSAG